MFNRKIWSTSTSILALMQLPAGVAVAQSPQDNSHIEEIVITARKQEETLITSPVAVTALSARRIEAAGLSDMRGLGDFTPGLVTNTGTQSGSRAGASITIRGMTPTMSGANASVYIDSAPVTSGVLEGVQDAERVEVLKGPQTAYFGRSTFAGAINMITKTPGDKFAGKVEAIVGSYSLHEERVAFEGPLVADKLSFRVTGRAFARDGAFRNVADGTRFGDQETFSGSGALRFTPSQSLSISAYGFIQRDDDGPGPNWKLSVPDYNCNAGAAPTTTRNYICGSLANRGSIPMGGNASITPQVTSLLLNNSTGIFNPLFEKPLIDHAGYARQAGHFHLNADYDLNGITISAIGAMNANDYVVLYDLDKEDSQNFPNPAFATRPNSSSYLNALIYASNFFDDWSGEVRVSSAQNQRFRWLIGGSYVSSRNANYVITQNSSGISAFGLGAVTYRRTPAVFGSVSYDIVTDLTLSLEGRYQSDKVESYNRTKYLSLGSIIAGATFNKFTPRAILKYQFTPATMAYVSYAQGTNPGTFNTSVLAFSQAIQDRLKAATGAGFLVRPETINNYELGVKSRFLDDRAQVTAAVYYARWKDQIVSQTFFDAPTGSNIVVNNNVGVTDLKGIELELEYNPIRQLQLSAQFAYNGTDIKNYVCVPCIAFGGAAAANVNGKKLPRNTLVNGSFSAQYTEAAFGDFDWYGRLDYIYKGPMYLDETNLAKTKPQSRANIRAGLQSDRIRIEGYVTNVLNNKAPTSVNRTTDSVRGGAVQVDLTPTNPREFGARASYSF